jgi:hypothetical protein
MAFNVESLCRLLVENNKFYHSINVINEVLPCEYGNEPSSDSSKSVELDGLQSDLSEFIHNLHVAERPRVKEVIQADIDLILAKVDSLNDLLRNRFETKLPWTRVSAMKDNKSKYKQHNVADPFYITSNRYNRLSNVLNGDDDSPANKGRLSE